MLSRTRRSVTAVLAGVGVTVLALLLMMVVSIPAIFIDPTLLVSLADATVFGRTLAIALQFVGMALAGLLYIWATGRGWGWIDLRVPNRRDLVWMGIGVALIIGYYIGASIIIQLLNVPAADSDVVAVLGDDVMMVLMMLILVAFFNAPAEEFLFRNVIQKRFAEVFSDWGAIVAASILFTLIHVPMFVPQAAELAATVTSLVILFGGSVIFGYTYVRSGNLLVPIVVHAAMNGFVLLIYLAALLAGVNPGQMVTPIGMI